MDIVPVGPRKIAPKGQVTIPAKVLSALGVAIGDDVWLVLNPDRPGTLVVVPADLMADLLKKGWTALG